LIDTHVFHPADPENIISLQSKDPVVIDSENVILYLIVVPEVIDCCQLPKSIVAVGAIVSNIQGDAPYQALVFLPVQLAKLLMSDENVGLRIHTF
jgi:hypothetical protein